MIQEELPSGEPPRGMHYTSKNIDHQFFEPEAEERRDDMIALNMPFLHSLITSKLLHAQEVRARERERKREMKRSIEDEEMEIEDEDNDDEMLFEEKEETSANDDLFDTRLGQTHHQKEQHRLRKVRPWRR